MTRKNVIQINGGITITICEKDYIWHVASTCSCENGKYLASVMDDSAIACDGVLESHDKETKTIPTNFNERKEIYILLVFLLITIALLITVSIYFYLIKYRAKQKHLFPFHDKNDELNQALYFKYKLKLSIKIKDVDI